jgi:hypothetical protein
VPILRLTFNKSEGMNIGKEKEGASPHCSPAVEAVPSCSAQAPGRDINRCGGVRGRKSMQQRSQTQPDAAGDAHAPLGRHPPWKRCQSPLCEGVLSVGLLARASNLCFAIALCVVADHVAHKL